jgi:hemoglobin
VTRLTLYEYAGGAPALTRFVAALHVRCLADEELSHPFTAAEGNPDHLANLTAYLAEVFGGPATYSATLGGHSGMLRVHAGKGASAEFNPRFVACFMSAADDAGLPADAAFRAAWRSFIEWAVLDVYGISAPEDPPVADDLPMPRWGWDGPAS